MYASINWLGRSNRNSYVGTSRILYGDLLLDSATLLGTCN